MSMLSSALLPVTVRPTAIADLPGQEVLRILVLPDLHIPFGPEHKQLLLNKRAFLDRHHWVVLLGDMTACYGTEGEYAQVNAFIRQLARPYAAVNGNHEFYFQPVPDGSADYGRVFKRADDQIQNDLRERFESFYHLKSRFQAGRFNGTGLCLLGLDRIDTLDSAFLDDENEVWFASTLEDMQDVPLVIFSHVPLRAEPLNSLRYYAEGRRPYYQPGAAVDELLRARRHPTLWLSGHLHIAPTHPLHMPYQTEAGVWQLHCPDGWGYGRADNEAWHPKHHERYFARTLIVRSNGIDVLTTDVATMDRVSEQHFDF